MRLCQYTVSPQILTNSAAICEWFFPATLLWYFNGDFLCLFFLEIYLYKNRLIRDFNIFSMGFNTILSLLFMPQILPALATESSFRLAPVPLWPHPSWSIPSYCPHQTLQAHLVSSLLLSLNQPLLQGSLSLYIGE